MYGTANEFWLTYPKMSEVSSATVAMFLTKASAIVDGYIAGAVTVPVTPAPPILSSISVDLAYAMFLRRNTQEFKADDAAQKIYEECLDALKFIKDGTTTLVGSGGVVLIEVEMPWSNVSQYVPTFGIRDVADARIDSDRLDSEYDKDQSWRAGSQ